MADSIMKLGLVLSATDKMSRVIDQAVGKSMDKIGKFQQKANKIGGAIQKWGLGMTAAGTAIEGGMFAAAQSVAATAGDLDKSAQKVGMTVEAWQRISYAASRTKMDADQFRMSLQRLQKQQVAAATGNKAAMDSFKMAGISIYDATGKLKTSDTLFTELSDKFKSAPDGPKKTALAMRLFGKTGAELIPLLNKGSSGIKAFEKQAQEMGLVLTKDNVEAFKKYSLETRRVKDAAQGLKIQLALGALPVLTKIAKKISELDVKLMGWVHRHKTLTNTILVGVSTFAGLLMVMGTFSIVAGTIIKSTSMIIKTFKALRFGLFAVRYGLFSAGAAMKSWAIWSKIVTAAQWLFNTSLYGCPIVWIIAGIMAVIAAVVLLVKYWKPITAFFKKLWDGIKAVFSATWNWIKKMFLNYTPQGLIIKNWSKIYGWFSSTIKKFREFGKNVMKGLWEGIKSLVMLPIKAITAVADGIKNKFKSIFGIHSPSKVFAEFGVNMNAGLSKGLEDGKPKSIAATRNLAKSTGNAFQSNSVINGGSPVTVTYAPQITIASGSQTDKESFARMLKDHKRELEQILRQISNNNARLSFS